MEKKKIFFQTQDPDEKIIRIIHRHPLTLIKEMFFVVALILISLTAMVFYFEYNIWYVFVIAFVIFLFSIITAFYTYFVWEKDVFVITDKRVVDVEQKSLFIKSQKEAPIDKIQDVSFNINGILGSLFRYGDIKIQTASDTSLCLGDISHPEQIQRVIFDLIKIREEDASDDEDSEDDLVMRIAEMLKKAIDKDKKQ